MSSRNNNQSRPQADQRRRPHQAVVRPTEEVIVAVERLNGQDVGQAYRNPHEMIKSQNIQVAKVGQAHSILNGAYAAVTRFNPSVEGEREKADQRAGILHRVITAANDQAYQVAQEKIEARANGQTSYVAGAPGGIRDRFARYIVPSTRPVTPAASVAGTPAPSAVMQRLSAQELSQR